LPGSVSGAEVVTSAAALVNTGRGGEELPDEAVLDRFVAPCEVTGGRAHDRAEHDAATYVIVASLSGWACGG